jgi:hypothetical protein
MLLEEGLHGILIADGFFEGFEGRVLTPLELANHEVIPHFPNKFSYTFIFL